MTNKVRTPAVAGTFYPQQREELLLQVYAYLNGHKEKCAEKPKAIIVPHAGYVFSGSTAASAYKQLLPYKAEYHRIVLLGSTHRVAVTGVVVPEAEYFSTPLGMVKLAADHIKRMVNAGIAQYDDNAHKFEHSLEVQLPFIQKVFTDIEVIPVLMGELSIEQAVQFLHSVWGEADTLIIVSSDLSHYHSATAAGIIDADTRRKIALNDPSIEFGQACASMPLNALMYLAQLKNLQSLITGYAHSGQHSGDNERVVGYLAATLSPTTIEDFQLGAVLLRIARAAIGGHWRKMSPLLFPEIPQLSELSATFVTLTKAGELRGCIGALQPYRSLFDDVQNNAISAAFNDPRFAPLAREELESVCIEVSRLSAAEKMRFSSEGELLAQLRPNVDGVIFRYRNYVSTFLPQVWEQLPTPEVFMRHLKVKAGLAENFWHESIEVSRYTVQKWKESDYGR